MTRFVAALLVAAGSSVRAEVDSRTRFAAALGPSRPAALLAAAHRDGRRRRKEDDALLSDLADALRDQQGGRP